MMRKMEVYYSIMESLMNNNFYHLPWFRKLRSVARSLGVLAPVKAFLSWKSLDYEQAVHRTLMKAVRKGDVVWDVGANMGVYTRHFLDWSEHKVIAFEPLPKAIQCLETSFKRELESGRLVIKPVALSAESGTAFFIETETPNDGVGTTSHLSDDGGGDIEVMVSTADTIMDDLDIPNVVKIDVEGFEEDVLSGGEYVFSHPDCREILIEMHFTRMDERQLGDAPNRIVKRLHTWGFDVKWVDSSHVHAYKV